ncbi:unnamed protein product [Didymodactylos carnosus]|uniref:ADP-ribosylglycohydrolase n=1 Tax=Didymodactylos carnosus TaxID=1234261 RepID=A0A815GL33_9BILA|nr:unnamed protein product [Didymodactylos carnosus]CAF1340015.1 unnamed protein product [Didymodactylos carnosus]CAF3615020.1 unnamed protein product [Didymodactylos carnosus]CAF4200154.1 unnamed protein product [Didymodactylos carnosus]
MSSHASWLNVNNLPHEYECPSAPLVSDESSERIIGSLLGLALGDALGAHAEFRPRTFLLQNPVTKLEGGGTWGLRAGQWTDDTSMALCLAASLIVKKGYDPYDQMVRYKWWWKHGYMSSTGQCFDIGNATQQSLEIFDRRQMVLAKQLRVQNEEQLDNVSQEELSNCRFDVNCSGPGVAGNGALMRLSPVPLFFYRSPILAIDYAGKSGRLTHGDVKAVDSCRYYAALICGALLGLSKEKLLDKDFYPNMAKRGWFGDKPLHPDVLKVALGSYQNPKGYDGGIRGKGYIVQALEAALWAFWSDEGSFRDGALNAVNLGDDADTTAAIYGQLAGAYYGKKGIPSDWLRQLYAKEFISCVGLWLHYEGYEWHKRSSGNANRKNSQSVTSTANFDERIHCPVQISPTHVTTSYQQQGHGNYPPPPYSDNHESVTSTANFVERNYRPVQISSTHVTTSYQQQGHGNYQPPPYSDNHESVTSIVNSVERNYRPVQIFPTHVAASYQPQRHGNYPQQSYNNNRPMRYELAQESSPHWSRDHTSTMLRTREKYSYNFYESQQQQSQSPYYIFKTTKYN